MKQPTIDKYSASSACSSLAAHGFVFTNPDAKSNLDNHEFNPSEPNAIMIAGKNVDGSESIRHVIATVFDDAKASYFFLAVDSNELTEHQKAALGDMRAIFMPLSSDVMFGCINFEHGCVSSRGLNGNFSLYEFIEQLKELKLPTRPYPATADALSLMPSFSDLAMSQASPNQVAKTMLDRLGHNAFDLDLPSSLERALDDAQGYSQQRAYRR